MATTTAWLTPASVVDAGGTGASWTSPSNAATSNNSRATASLGTSLPLENSNPLVATDFGFAIPTGDTITLVEVEIEGLAVASSVSIAALRRVHAGLSVTPNPSTFVTGPLTTSDATYVSSWTIPIGGGPSTTPTDANATDFGVQVVFNNANASNRSVSVDAIRMRITYDPPPSTQAPRSMNQYRQRRT